MNAPRGDQRSRRAKHRVTFGLAVLMAVAALVVGIVLGYVARGGPPDPVLVTTQQELPVVTAPPQDAVP